MLIPILPQPAGLFILLTTLLLAAVVAAAALLPRAAAPAPAGPGGPAGAPGGDRWRLGAFAGGLALAALAAGFAARQAAESVRPLTFTLGDFALLEREFRYREQVYERRIALLAQTHDLEIREMRERYETELSLLRDRYEEAWQNLTRNNEALVRSVAAQFGLDADFLARIAGVESGFDSTIANPESGARGLFQFMPATWNEIGRSFADRLADAGLSYLPVDSSNRGTDADPRNDARLNTVMGALLTRYNIELTQSDDPAIVYLAHFAGPEMARYVRDNLEENPDQPIRDALRAIMPGLADAVIEQNAAAYEADMTLQDFYRYAAARFDGIDGVLQPGETVDADEAAN
jgi:soluble lytic murein transglycosylase-like protein